MLNSLWEQILNLSLLAMMLRTLPPILLGALGGLMTDRAGVTNIGIEGLMLISAFTSIATGAATGSWIVGVLLGTAAAMAVSALMAFFALDMKVDIIIVGFAVNLFGSAITVLLMSTLFGSNGGYSPERRVSIPNVELPFLEQVPVIGKLLSGHNAFVWLSLAATVCCFYVLFRTPYGMHLRATGEEPAAARSLGIRVDRIQYSALLWSGLFSGLAGAYLSMGMTSMFVRDMVAGTGFLALAVVIFGNRSPLGILGGSAVFALATSVSIVIETTPGNTIPSQFIKMVPYAVTVAALVVYALRNTRDRQLKLQA